MGAEDELASFFIYSMMIYPLIGYVLSPERKYSKWKGVGYAVLIFSALAILQLAYDAHQQGPNYYQRLHIDREASLSVIKKSFKKLSLELHPDKNRSPGAVERYLSVKTAYEILSDSEKRDIYNRLGERGLEMAAHNSAGLDILLIRIAISTATSLFFTFLLTVSDPSGHSMTISLMTIAVVFILELKFVLLGASLPSFLFPSLTPHNLLAAAHSLKPTIMHCSRSIFSSLHINPLAVLSHSVATVSSSQKVLNGKFAKILRQIQNVFSQQQLSQSTQPSPSRPRVEAANKPADETVTVVLESLRKRVGKEDLKDPNRGVEKVRRAMSKEPSNESSNRSGASFPLYYLGLYFVARWLLYGN